jgi:hypothetical protein
MSKNWEGKVDASSAHKVMGYLFDKEDGTENKYLDMRTDIQSPEMFKAVHYYRILDEYYQSKAAGIIANILERLAISGKRMGRLEAVTILRQQMPKEETIIRGIADSLKKVEESGQE